LIYLNLDNDSVPFFQEPEVRQALLYALDRQAVIDKVLDGQAVVSHSPVLPDSWAYEPEIATYEYDPGKAMALLEEAGWAGINTEVTENATSSIEISPTIDIWYKDRRPLSFSLLVPNDPLRMAVAEEVVGQWAAVGIQAEIVPVASGLVSEHLEPRDYQAALVDLDLSLSGDPDPYTFWHQTEIERPGQNYAGYDSREASEILETARLTTNRGARAELYREFQRLFARDVPALLLYHPVYSYAVDQYVYGVHVGPLVRPGDRFLGVADWYVRLRRVISSNSSGAEDLISLDK
jgi:peptide/nickel transport system substrate-binding protein